MVKKWKLILLLFAAVVVLAAMNLVGRSASTADQFGHATNGAHADSASGEGGCCPGH